MPDQIQIQVFGSLPAAEETWRRFEAIGTHTVFQTFDWAMAWFDTMAGPDVEPCPVAVTDGDGTPLLFLGLYRRQRRWRGRSASVIDWIAAPVADYLSPILGPRAPELGPLEIEDIWCSVLEALPASDLLLLHLQPATVKGVANPLCHLDLRHQTTSHLTRLSSDWDTYHKGKLKSARRADSRRKLRRLGEAGTLHLGTIDTTAQRLAVLDVAVAQKRERLVATGRGDMFATGGFEQFYRTLTERHPDLVHLCALQIDDEVVATVWGVVHDGVYYYLMPTFDGGRWAVHSPGRLLTEWLLEHCTRLGLGTFDFTIGDESYKDEWCEVTVPLYRAELVRTARGKLIEAPVRVKRRLATSPRLAPVRSRLRPGTST